MGVGLFFFIIVLISILLLFAWNIRIVPQSQAYVIERLGSFKQVWSNGLHVKIPIIERIVSKVSLKEQVVDFLPQAVITSDNVTMKINTVVYYQITDPKLYTYGVERPLMAIENLTATTLRNIIGSMELDQTLTSRDAINTQLRTVLDEATNPWGIKINRVELKDIIPPEQIIQAMEKQMKAEREKREEILQAEGRKTSQILIAQGNKESVILDAEGNKESMILAAEADREAAIRRAEGEAEAIRIVQQAHADAIRLINEADPEKGYLTLQSLEALAKVADGNATKLIIPSNLQDLTGLVASLKEATDLAEKPKEIKQ
ncbi:SPFH domain-containing protein [Massilibacterium senegalense]|uniref:SPFH domain-containing protein n=1 Tax=Massilibacterium senegalense TaxID=1632858 RepID=UPI000783041D|nr:SPFH domain-containing protein [Massilibacterium senegalense]